MTKWTWRYIISAVLLAIVVVYGHSIDRWVADGGKFIGLVKSILFLAIFAVVLEIGLRVSDRVVRAWR